MPAPQAAPLVFRPTQLVPEQYAPEAQSALLAHVVLQAVPAVLHVYAPQLVVVIAGHAPAVQLAGSVATPAVQEPVRHDVVGYVHVARVPATHEPPHVPVPVHAVRPPTGAPVTCVQVPTLPVTLHASH